MLFLGIFIDCPLSASYILEINEKVAEAAIIACWERYFSARQRTLQEISSYHVYLDSIPHLATGKILVKIMLNMINHLFKSKTLRPEKNLVI